MIIRTIVFFALTSIAIGFMACCEPAPRNSNPVFLDSLFKEQQFKDHYIDTSGNFSADSLYYPAWTWTIMNSGTDADDFTLHVRHPNPNFDIGYDITRHIAPGQTAIFKSPVISDSATIGTKYYFPLWVQDTIMTAPYAFYGFFGDSLEVTMRNIQPRLSITYGSVDRGPEACNTPSTTRTLSWAEFKVK